MGPTQQNPAGDAWARAQQVRVQWGRQPTWAQRVLVGVIGIMTLGVMVILGTIALVVGGAAALVLGAAYAINRFAQRLSGSGRREPGDSLRSNVRVIRRD